MKMELNMNITVEIYSWIDDNRVIELVEYTDTDTLDKDIMLRKLSGTWVGHRIFGMSMDVFKRFTSEQQNDLPNVAVFDKHSYIAQGRDMKGKIAMAFRKIQNKRTPK
jgi:hypothetical protein